MTTALASAHERTVATALTAFTTGTSRGVVVDSPPGAGKTSLVVRAAAQLGASQPQVAVVAQTNQQVDSLITRLALEAPQLRLGRLSATDYTPPAQLMLPNLAISSDIAVLREAAVVIGTAAKWQWVADGVWPLAIIDEAYQMRSDTLLRIAARFARILFVGDPGQLDPFTVIAEQRWAGLAWDPTQSAMATLLRLNPSLPVYRLPASFRLPATAAPVISEAFYPFTAFEAATTLAQRRLELATRGFGTDADRVLDHAADTGWALCELPARHAPRTDAEAVAAVAATAGRILERGATAYSERQPDGASVTAERIAVGAAHRDQVAAISQQLRAAGHTGIRVDTANRLQGSEYDIVVVLHPLSGRRDATTFHLEAGRLCVLCSRHRHACIVVARAGIGQLLDAHPSTEPVHLNVPEKFPDGWEANQAMLTHLTTHRIPAR